MKSPAILFVILVLNMSLVLQTTAQWTNGTDIYNTNTGNVGIGVSQPLEKLHIGGALRGDLNFGALRIQTDFGYLDLGSQNSSWAHIESDLSKFYFNKPIYIDGALSSYYALNLDLKTGGTTRMTILNANGNVGIGTTAPDAKLVVNGGLKAGNIFASPTLNDHLVVKTDANVAYEGGEIFINADDPNAYGIKLSTAYSVTDDPGLRIGVVNVANPNTFTRDYLYLRSGRVGIGTTQMDAKLTVNGDIHGKEVRVDLSVPGPDYVFEKEYQLRSLDELENYININKHLPEVPSAREMEENGIKVGEMNMLLLKKVEELTLYVIALKKENEKQQRQIDLIMKD